MKSFYKLPLAILCSINGALCTSAFAKGLDSLQADVPETSKTTETTPAAGAPATPAVPAAAPETPTVSVPEAQKPLVTPPPSATIPSSQTTEVKPGLQNFYLASGFSWINLSGSKGGWHSSTMGDVEAGYKVASVASKYDVFGTLRYRPVSVDIVSEQRGYRAIVESYLFGAKGMLGLNQRTSVDLSAELGFTDTHVNSIDSIVDIDQDLEKSGVDLNLGAGVSYIVLEKIGIGSRIAFGAGAYKTLQLGLDIRFLL